MANTLQGHRTGILKWYDFIFMTLRTPRREIQIPCLNTCNTRRTVFDGEPKKRVTIEFTPELIARTRQLRDEFRAAAAAASAARTRGRSRRFCWRFLACQLRTSRKHSGA
jgi:hypothetical protein